MLLRLLALTPMLFWLLLPGALRADAVAVIETPAASPSLAPRLVALDGNRAVLTWIEREGASHGLHFAVFEGGAFGKAGTITRGDLFANWADTPGLALDGEGAWYAHWLQRSGQGTYAYDVMVAISRDAGQSWSEAFRPHRDGTLTEHGFVSHFAEPGPGVALVWLDGRDTAPAPADRSGDAHQHGGGAMTLRSARLLSEGGLDREVLLDARVCDCCATASALTAEGPIVAYRNRSDDEIRDIHVVRRTGDGWTEPAPVHADGWRITGCPVNGPAVIARDREVVVAWFTLGADEVPRVRVARSRDGGRQFGEPLTIDAGSAIGRVDLAWTAGGWVLSWMSQAPSGGVVRLARFAQDGEPLAQRNLVAVEATRSSGFPRLLALEDGTLLLAWTGRSNSGESQVRVGRIVALD